MTALFFSPRRKVQTLWSFTADGVIWRLLPTPEGYFVGEDRNKDGKTVTFFCLHEESGDVLWSKLKFDEPWWIGIEAAHKEFLFIHEFATPDLPDHKKIHAVDLMTGRVLWSNGDAKFLLAANESVYTARETFDARIFTELDIRTGEIRGEVDPASVNVLRDLVPHPSQLIDFPSIVDLANLDDSPASKAVKSILSGDRRIVYIECLEKNGTFIIVYYENVSEQKEIVLLDQHLTVIDGKSGKSIFKDVLNKGTNMAVPDTYFAKGETIFYIKDKQTLHAIAVPAES